MDTVTLIFTGLICHVLTSGDIERAVFVNAPTHVARIVVAAPDVVEVRGLPEERSHNPGERVFLLNDRHLILNSGAAGRTVVTASFARHVTSLSRISDATSIRDEVEAGVLFDGAHAYVDLRGGQLSADEGMLQEVAFAEGRAHMTECLTMQVIYTAKSGAGQVTFAGTDGELLSLRAGATARLSNEPPPDFTIPHYHMYSMLLKDATYVATPHATGRSCAADDRTPQRNRFGINSNALAPRPNVPFDQSCSPSGYP